MQTATIREFIRIARSDITYSEQYKRRFHRKAINVLKALASHLDLTPGSYDIRSNIGGPAVAGEITLHTDHLYFQLSAPSPHAGDIMWRTCDGRKDFTGHRNQWIKLETLLDMDTLSISLSRHFPTA